MTRKLGLLVVGQSPRPEIETEFKALVPDVDLLQRGCLDGLTRQEIAALEPAPGEAALFTRLPDGEGVKLSKSAVVRHGAAQLKDLEESGVLAVVMLCTGEFPAWEGRRVLFPSRIMRHFVSGLLPSGHLGIISPLESQLPAAERRWSDCGYRVTAIALSPNATPAEVSAAGQVLSDTRPDLLVLDCVSYLRETKRSLCKATGRPGVLAITSIARSAAEMLDGYAPTARQR